MRRERLAGRGSSPMVEGLGSAPSATAAHPQRGRAITAASNARAPANIAASGKTVFAIAPSKFVRWWLVERAVIFVTQVMNRSGFSGRANQCRDADQAKSPGPNRE